MQQSKFTVQGAVSVRDERVYFAFRFVSFQFHTFILD